MNCIQIIKPISIPKEKSNNSLHPFAYFRKISYICFQLNSKQLFIFFLTCGMQLLTIEDDSFQFDLYDIIQIPFYGLYYVSENNLVNSDLLPTFLSLEKENKRLNIKAINNAILKYENHVIAHDWNNDYRPSHCELAYKNEHRKDDCVLISDFVIRLTYYEQNTLIRLIDEKLK